MKAPTFMKIALTLAGLCPASSFSPQIMRLRTLHSSAFKSFEGKYRIYKNHEKTSGSINSFKGKGLIGSRSDSSVKIFFSSKNGYADDENFTTNAEDQQEAAKLQQRLTQSSDKTNSSGRAIGKFVPSVDLAEGRHKYVLISARQPSLSEDETNSKRSTQRFVVSKYLAPYHRNVAEPFVEKLESNGYENIRVLGGGRISLDNENKKVEIFGFSYGFGKADHELSKAEVDKDSRYSDYKVMWSDEGY